MKRRTTIVDIANHLGITPSAVSKALSNHPRISKQTKLAVAKAVEDLGYKPNALATGLRKGRSGLIGILVPGIHYGFFANAIKGAEDILSAAGYSVVIAQSKDLADIESKQLHGLVKAQVEGIIASLAMQGNEQHAFRAISKILPLVLFDRTFEDDHISTVTIDDYAGAVMAVDHLYEMGYRRIAHLAGFKSVLPFQKRIAGYQEAIRQHGLTFREEYVIECKPSDEDGVNATHRLLDLPEPPDAIFAASDYLALGAMKVVKKRLSNLSPASIGIVGFSNEGFTTQVSPTISTIDQFSERMGATAATILLEQIGKSGSENAFQPAHKVLIPELLIRESSLRKLSTEPITR